MLMRQQSRKGLLLGLLGALTIAGGGCALPKGPKVDDSPTSQALASLPRFTGPKKTVAVGEFESAVPDAVSARAATDMFVTALVKSGAFDVLDPAAMPAAPAEKGRTRKGRPAPKPAPLPYAYIFKGKVSEANLAEADQHTKLKAGGMELQGQQGGQTIGIDVRIVDARSGVIVDAVNVRKEVQSKGSNSKGMGALLGKWVKEFREHDVDLDTATAHKESLDAALRACIEQAVIELVTRLHGTTTQAAAVP